jgi:hypothetical protein
MADFYGTNIEKTLSDIFSKLHLNSVTVLQYLVLSSSYIATVNTFYATLL